MERKRSASMALVWARCLCGIGLLGLGVLVGACRDSVGTALFVTIDFPTTLTMDQLRVSGEVDGNGIGPHLLPEQSDRLLTNGETFRILLPEAPDLAEVQLQVEGLREGAKVALGTGRVQVREGTEVDVTVRLEPTDFCPNCPDGCCVEGTCTTPTFNTCGSGGINCFQCNAQTADSCSAQGFCACGRGPACDPSLSDRCSGGLCRCGQGGPCAAGQACVGGRCVCSPDSCTGCCANNTCQPGNQTNVCGKGGVACVKCNRRCNADGTCS